MHTLLVALTVLEIAALVLVLAIALIRIQSRLRVIAADLGSLIDGVDAVERDLSLIAPNVPKINQPLEDIVGALASIAELAEIVARAER